MFILESCSVLLLYFLGVKIFSLFLLSFLSVSNFFLETVPICLDTSSNLLVKKYWKNPRALYPCAQVRTGAVHCCTVLSL